MFENSIPSIVNGVVSGTVAGFFLLVVEYWTDYFANRFEQPDAAFRALLVRRVWKIGFGICLVLFVLIIWATNRGYVQDISASEVNTVAAISGTMLLFLILLARKFSQPLGNYYILTHLASQTLVLPLVIVIGTVALAFTSPRYVVSVLSNDSTNSITPVLVDRIDRYLDLTGRNNISTVQPWCIGPCPLPDELTEDGRILLVVSSDRATVDGSSYLKLKLTSNCRNDPSPLREVYRPQRNCVSNAKIPYDSFVYDSFVVEQIDAHLPIILLESLVVTKEQSDNPMALINEAIVALDSPYLAQDIGTGESIIEGLFYDILYDIPGLSRKERIESAGEVRARAERYYGHDLRDDYLTAHWYEAKGIYSPEALTLAIGKYQQIIEKKPEEVLPFDRLSDLSLRLQRKADAVCYLAESLKLQPSAEKKSKLESLLHELGMTIGLKAFNHLEFSAEALEERMVDKNDAVDSTSIQEYFELARVALNNKNYGEALKYVDRIMGSANATEAEKAGALYLRGDIYLFQAKYEKAVAAYSEFVDISERRAYQPENLLSGYKSLGHVYHSMGRHKDASEALRKALEYSDEGGQSVELLALLGNEYQYAGQYDTALKTLVESKNRYDTLDWHYSTLQERIAYHKMLSTYGYLLEDLDQRNRYFDSVAEFYTSLIEEIIKTDAEDFAGCLWVSEVLYPGKQSPYTELRDIETKPKIPAHYYRSRAQALFELGKEEDALNDISTEVQILEIEAETAAEFYTLGLAYLTLEQYPDAIAACQKAVDLDGIGIEKDIADAVDYFCIGSAYKALSKSAEAVEALSIAVQLQLQADPAKAARYLRDLGDEYDKLQEYEKAIESYQRAIQNRRTTGDQPIADDYQRIGDVYYKWGVNGGGSDKLKKAISAYNEAIVLDNRELTVNALDAADSEDWQRLGHAYRELAKQLSNESNFEKAIYAYTNSELLQESPNRSAGLWWNMGLTHREWGKIDPGHFEAAIDAFKKAIVLDYPEETELGTDTWDVADWYQIAAVYKDWSHSEPSKILEAKEAIISCLRIPITEENRDYHWHKACQELQAEMTMDRDHH